jgi:amino acid adenylation domain-containing protein
VTDRGFLGTFAIAAGDYKEERDYWLNRLSGDLQRSIFPYDRPVVKLSAAAGKGDGDVSSVRETVGMKFTGPVFSRIMEACRSSDYVLHMILVAGVVALLSRSTYIGEKDIMVGIPIYKQENDRDLLNTILPIRVQLEDRTDFRELLFRVRQAILDAHKNQNYPMEVLLVQMNIPYSGQDDEFPLFDVVVLVENIHEKEYILHTHPNVILSFLRSDDSIEGTVEYNGMRYDMHTMERMVSHFKCLLENVIFYVDQPVSGIDILSEEEKQQLLKDFNGTRTDYPAGKTIDALFKDQVERRPDSIAVVSRETNKGTNNRFIVSLTYKELNEKADALASYLRSLGIKHEEPVVLMADNSHKVIVALLAILKAGGAYLPVNIQYPDQRKRYIIDDCQAEILITNCVKTVDYASPVIDLDDNDVYSYQITREFPKEYSSDHLAYIIYTSGSTGKPKGVMVEHRGVVRLVRNTDYIRFNVGDSILLTGALEFDASTFEIWGALLNGLTLHLVNKDTILNHQLLKRVIMRNRITTIWMTSPLFNQVLDADIEVFSGLKNLLVGGDILSPVHINRVKKRFPRLKVINGYGPTENTTFSTTFPVSKEYNDNIPIGKPIVNSTAYILDNNYRLVPIGVIGELYVGGDGLARGYLNNPELTNKKFLRGVQGGSFFKKRPPGKIYKTGDLARWLADGNIEFLGRIDDQVKIRGYRIEPGEIENHLMQVDFIRDAVVLARENREGEKYLCAYVVPAEENVDKFDVVELKKKLFMSLPDYMVPVYFFPLEAIPLTPNGKVDREALPEPVVSNASAVYVSPRNRMEEIFTEIWSEVLRVEKSKIGIDADFFELGGNSLKAAVLISRLHQAFNIKITLDKIFTAPCIRRLVKLVKGLKKDRFTSLAAAEKKEYYRLSSAQRRLYVIQQMALENIGYNIPQVVELEGILEREKLEQTFRKLIQRHESLRTSFQLVEEEPVQRIHEDIEFGIDYYDLAAKALNSAVKSAKEREEIENIIFHFVRPFDLAQPSLLRVGLIKVGKSEHILMVDMHHIITDGTSMDLFVKEFAAVYAGKELPVLRLQYNDYTEWQSSEEQREAIKPQQEYWLKQLADEPPVVNLPIDFPRPEVQSFEGRMINFRLSIEETASLNRLALGQGVTLYMVLLAVTQVFLGKICDQEDIIIGAPIGARRHVDLEKIVGMFVNTLVLRNFPSGSRTFNDFLGDVKKRTLEAFENRDYPFEDLVGKVVRRRDASRHPLFDVGFVLQNMEAQAGDIPRGGIPGLRIKPYENQITTSKFDLCLNCMEQGEILTCAFEYGSKLFKKETIERFVAYFKRIVFTILEDIETPIREIDILTKEERDRILFDFNNTAVTYPGDKVIHQFFEEQVERTPDRVAITGVEQLQITYGKLDEESNQLAHYLRPKSVGPDTIVGIMLERSVEMIIGILGILKAGGGYLPIDLNYPQDRIYYMLKDSNARALVSELSKVSEVSEGIEVIDINAIIVMSEDIKTTHLTHLTHPTHLCYIIYTSGSTGRPKGTMITHSSLMNQCTWHSRYYNITEADHCTQFAGFGFDASVFEIFPYLTRGAALHIISDDMKSDISALEEYYNKNNITITFFPTQFYQHFIEQEARITSLRTVITGGEKLNRFVKKSYNLYNNYGPTENTVVTTACLVEKEYNNIPIGKPIQNNQVYILGKNGFHLQPIGIPGELCITGNGLARGYLNQPELTAEKFDHDLWDFQDYRDEKGKETGNRINKKFLRGPGDTCGAEIKMSTEAKHHLNHLLPLLHCKCSVTLCATQWGFLKSAPGRRRQKIYRTGDLARWLADGNIEYIGRLDQQVKIRGYRIELEEIECRLLQHETVAEAAVIAWETENVDKCLCAYIVPASKEEEIDPGELKRFLSAGLPGYMVPIYFIVLEKMPLSHSGKLDREKLPEPERVRPELAVKLVLPGTEMEKLVAGIWQEVMDLEEVGIHDNFFDLGGTSFTIIRANKKLRKRFQKDIPVLDMFRYPTVHALAAYLQDKETGGIISREEIDEKMERLEQTFQLLTGVEDE